MATKADTNGQTQAIRPEQELAIEKLILGATDADAATAAGVNRQTVNTWRNHDPSFIAALNDRRQAIWTGHTDRIRQLISTALDVLAEDLDIDPQQQDNRRVRQTAAVHVLRSAGLYGANLTPTGPTDTESADVELRTKASDRRERSLMASLGI